MNDPLVLDEGKEFIETINHRCVIKYGYDSWHGYYAALKYRHVYRTWYGRLKSKWTCAKVWIIELEDIASGVGKMKVIGYRKIDRDERNRRRDLFRRIEDALDES